MKSGLMRLRHYSRRTEEANIGWIRRYILFHGKRHPRDLGESDIAKFLSSLAVEGRVAASTQNQALNACCFCTKKSCGTSLVSSVKLSGPSGRQNYRSF
jgi:hypothetical protein